MIDDPSKYDDYNVIELHTAITMAITRGSLEDIKYIFTSPFVKNKHQINIHLNKESFLEEACVYGHLDIVKYLLTSPDLKEHSDITANSHYCFQNACQSGHLEVVKYMATSPDLKVHSDIIAANNSALQNACCKNHVEIVSYLLTSPDLKVHPGMDDVTHRAHGSFKLASINNSVDVLQYLIFDYNIEKTEYLKFIIDAYPNSEVEKMFKLRDVHDELKQELSTDNFQPKKLKM
jgi:ankyrin repeat protein